MAAAQGPKGLIMWAAERALSETPFGEKVAQYQAYLEGLLGKAIAEGVERKELDAEYDSDSYLLGGGSLIANLLVGSAVGGAGSKVISVKGSSTANGNASGGASGSSPRTDGVPVERVQAGSKGDSAINGDLKPRTAYELSNGHTYVTDASGRVSTVEGTLDLTKMDRNTYQQCKVGHCGNSGDDGGHLIASSLGGAGDKINIVPQASTLNRGDWRAMENSLRKDLEAGKSVSVKVEVKYPPGDGIRPSEFKVYAMIDGELKQFTFVQ